MKKLSLLFSKFCLMAMMALPLFTACNNDEEEIPEPPINHGFYVVNEGWFGHDPGSINYYDLTAKSWQENLYKSHNTGKTLGNTSTNAVIYNDKMYIVSKDVPYLVQVNKSDFKHIASIEEKGTLGTNGQGYNFCIVNSTTGILTSSEGAFKTALAPLALGEQFVNGRCGDIIKSGNYIFMIVDSQVNAYNAADLTLAKENLGAANTGFTQSKDGSLWAANNNVLLKMNPATLTSETIELPVEYEVYYNSAAYTPSGLCASPSENALYFVKKDGWSPKEAYKYSIDSKALTKIITAPADYSFYGAGLSVNPKTGMVVALFMKDYKSSKIIITNGIAGENPEEIDYPGDYWFPSKVVFE